MKERLYIVMPTYNEEKNIETVVREWHEIIAKVGEGKLVVVDDGSRDNTQLETNGRGGTIKESKTSGAVLILQKYIPLLRQVVLYGVFGCFSAFVDVLIFSLLSGFLSMVPANIISVHCGILCSFLLNTFFTFRVKDKMKQRIAIFLCVGYFGLLLSMLILWLGVDKMRLDKIWVKIVSVFIVAIVQFLLNKFITYRDSKEG